MNPRTLLRRNKARRTPAIQKKRRRPLQRLLENKFIRTVSYETYRAKVRDVYDGPKGAILSTASLISLHVPLGDRWLRKRKFDLRGVERVLDVGSGAGQIARHVIKYADSAARITCVDLSVEMLKRARIRTKSRRATYLAADLTRLPFDDGAFDCVTCGYVLEHLPDARLGLAEMARVLEPGGRILLLTTEDNFSGAWTSRFWCCRTYNREELRRTCQELGLMWKQELWYTPMHKLLRAGGICVELLKE
jgi:ubiquinone/menaquinone biosynthesis C-methylase UbiE